MKRITLCLALVIFAFTACNDTPGPAGDGVISEIRYESGDQGWTDTYQYNDQAQVASITTDQGLGQTKVFSYSSNLPLEIITVRNSDEQLVFRDSIAYDENGRVDKVYNFSINVGPDVALSNIKSFTYDANGNIAETNTEYVNIPDYTQRRVYVWRDGNIVQADYYTRDQLRQEFFFSYDDRPAVHIENFVSIGGAGIRTENNLISTDWIDHSGLLDTACKPCETTYAYGLNSLPVSLRTNWNFSATLIYKKLVSPVD